MRGRRGWVGAGVVAGLVIVTSLPFYWALVASVTSEARLFGAPTLLPREFLLDHYRALFTERAFLLPIRNSLVVAGATAALCLLLGTPAAYALARLRFRGRGALLALVLAVSMFPQISIVSPLYLLLRALGLIDTYPGLVLPYMTFAMPLTLWLLVGVFRQLPPEIEEAALVDGAGRVQALTRVLLPLAAPGIATAGIVTFIYAWNEFLFALSFTLGPERQTVPVAIALFQGRYQVPWGEVLAGALVATAPVALLVLIFQRRITGGLASGAVKG